MRSTGWRLVETFVIARNESPAERLTVEAWAEEHMVDTHDGPSSPAGRPNVSYRTSSGDSVCAKGDGSGRVWFQVEGRPGHW